MNYEPGWYWVESPVEQDGRLYPALRRQDGIWQIWGHVGHYSDVDFGLDGGAPSGQTDDAFSPDIVASHFEDDDAGYMKASEILALQEEAKTRARRRYPIMAQAQQRVVPLYTPENAVTPEDIDPSVG